LMAGTAAVIAAPGGVVLDVARARASGRAEPLDGRSSGLRRLHGIVDQVFATRGEVEFVHAQFADFVVHVALLVSSGLGRNIPTGDRRRIRTAKFPR
jgi:hypothetical protein